MTKNIIYNFLGQGLLLVLGFISVKYIFSQLGGDALGIIYFTLAMNALLCVVLEMGVCSTIVREVSTHYEDNPSYICDLIRTASLFFWGAYAIAGTGVYFLAPVFVEKWINLETMSTETAIYVLRILGIAALLALPKSFYVSLFRGIQRMEFNNFIDVATMALQQSGAILILVFGGGLFHVVYWFGAFFGIRIIAYVLTLARFFRPRSLLPGYSSIVIRKNIGFALRMTAITVFSTIHTQADKVIISKLLPLAAFGYYGVAHANVSKGTLLTSAISQAAYPSLSELFASGDRRTLMSQYRKLHDLVCYGIVPVFALIPFAATPLFSFILNENAAEKLFVPLMLLCIGFYMNGTLNIPHFFALAVGKPGIAARSNFYALFFALPVTVLLIYFLGLTGAGLSWIFYHVFTYLYAVPRICRECLEMPVREWYGHVIRIFVLIGLTYGTAWLALDIVNSHSIVSLATAYLAASIIFCSVTYFMISGEFRKSLSFHLRAFRERLAEAIS